MENILRAIKDWLTNSAFLRVLFISFIILLLQIPIEMINSQVSERNISKQQATHDVTSKWGYRQNIVGPRIVVPYYEIKTWTNRDGKQEQIRNKLFASFLPETFNLVASVKNEKRYRGMFEVPLYQTSIDMNGHFKKPDFSKWDIDPKLIIWDDAEIILGISDARGIQKQAYIKWNDKKLSFESGIGRSGRNEQGFHVPLKEGFTKNTYSYQINITLNGSQQLYATPIGKISSIKISSDWPDPSFQGYILPTKREISTEGFNAEWEVTSISRQYPQSWLQKDFKYAKLNQSLVGVNFITPVDNYRMTERSIKYVMLFLLFTFVVIWLIEVIAGVRVHLLQYLLLGLGICLFYLLLLAFSEHIGFTTAYIIASIAIIIMTGSYSMAVLKTRKRAFIVGGGISALYIYLFTLLQEQNYSLLFGSIGVFAALAAVMYITRNIDWYALGKK